MRNAYALVLRRAFLLYACVVRAAVASGFGRGVRARARVGRGFGRAVVVVALRVRVGVKSCVALFGRRRGFRSAVVAVRMILIVVVMVVVVVVMAWRV